MKLSESSLFASLGSVNRYNARDIADLTFLYLITLHILRSNWESIAFAKNYAHKTMIYGSWEHEHINSTDLYQLLYITLNHSSAFLSNLKNPTASKALIHDLMLDSHDVNRFLQNIAASTYNDHLSDRLLLKFERELRINVTNYKSVRRIAADWNTSHIDDEAKSLAVTRLLQAMQHRAVRGDLLNPLQKLAEKERLLIASACNPETGANCEAGKVTTAQPKLGLLKSLVVATGMGVGAYYLGKALAGGFKK